MIEELTGTTWARRFDSLHDMQGWLSDNRANWKADMSGRYRPEKNWDLNTDYRKAMGYARDGWEEGVRRLEELASGAPVESVRIKRYGVSGEFPDIGRYNAGDQMNMISRPKTVRVKEVMTLVINTAASCGVGANEMANFGAACYVLVDRLESRGIRCEVLGAQGVMLRGGFRGVWSWTVKAAEDAVDLAALAFGLAHPAMFRRLGFACAERLPAVYECQNYGVPTNIRREELVIYEPKALIINGITVSAGSCATMAGALAFAAKQINEAAVAMGMGEIAELEEHYA